MLTGLLRWAGWAAAPYLVIALGCGLGYAGLEWDAPVLIWLGIGIALVGGVWAMLRWLFGTTGFFDD
jgi:hypothetical protein